MIVRITRAELVAVPEDLILYPGLHTLALLASKGVRLRRRFTLNEPRIEDLEPPVCAWTDPATGDLCIEQGD